MESARGEPRGQGDAGRTYYAGTDILAICAMLTDFGNEVRAQRGKELTKEVADDLTADAEAIMTAIGCE